MGIRTEPLNATRGIHSPAIEPILDDLQRAAERLDARPPDRPLVSNLTGGFVTEAPDGVYWRRHAREPVRFLDGVRALSRDTKILGAPCMHLFFGMGDGSAIAFFRTAEIAAHAKKGRQHARLSEYGSYPMAPPHRVKSVSASPPKADEND